MQATDSVTPNKVLETPKVVQTIDDLPPDAQAFLRGSGKPQKAQEAPSLPPTHIEAGVDPGRIETEINPLTNPAAPSMQNSGAWMFSDAQLGDITLTDYEKTVYFKAAMNDEPVFFEVQLGAPNTGSCTTARIRSLSHYEIDAIFRATRLDFDEGTIDKDDMGRINTPLWYSYIQWYSACLQVVSFNGKGLDHLTLTFNSEDGALEKDAQLIRDHYRKKHRAMQSARWHAILMAMRIFEAKMKICNDALANGNFWKPASGV